MRICSFLPSATEIVYTLGVQDQFYSVTFECDSPPEARHKPIAVRSVFEEHAQLSSGEIDAITASACTRGSASTTSMTPCCKLPSRSLC